ncbi:hypothetical protein PQR62_19205 [Herbaspirillum lusitanum]|jgi:hypothetical protein|uniref:Uncharacterized protein n=1 Tax=Herbaspirillum lusitanum TaxID=213312 RepID=A0ABW9AF58_9BURK
MINKKHAKAVIFMAIGLNLHSIGNLWAATPIGQVDVSAIVTEKCRIDFSEGSADFFQSCSSGDGLATTRASNVLGSVAAAEATVDPYYLDRDPDTLLAASAAGAANELGAQRSATAAADRRRRAPKVVTIHY